jgi:hypothetical protein
MDRSFLSHTLGKSSITIEKEDLLLKIKSKKYIEYNLDFFIL